MTALHPPSPSKPALHADRIPELLRQAPRWCLWRAEPRPNGKVGKVPHQASGAHARTNDRTTWATFDRAIAAYRRGGFTGIGIVMDAPAADEPAITAIDIDGCIDPDGTLTPTAAAIVALLDSYTEISPSGRGLRVFVQGTVPAGSRKRVGAIECYSDGQFVTVTGNHLPDTPETVNKRPAALAVFCMTYLTPAEEGGDRHDQHGGGQREDAGAGVPAPNDLDDDQLLHLARRAATGREFTRLFDAGDTDLRDGDHSRADYSLCRMLLFWTGGDLDRADRLFRRSALYREKWDEARDGSTYGMITLQKAAATVTNYYCPAGGAGVVGHDQHDDTGGINGDRRPACGCGCCEHHTDDLAEERIVRLTRERDQAIRERDEIRELHRATLDALANPALNPQARIAGVRTTFRVHGGTRDADGFVPVFIGTGPEQDGSLAALTGASRKRLSTHLERLTDAGVFDRRVEKVIPDKPNAPAYNRVRLRPRDDSPLATLQRIAAVRPEPVGAGHGGKRVRRCPEGCDAPIIVRTDHICSACGTLIDRQERTDQSAMCHDDPPAGTNTEAVDDADAGNRRGRGAGAGGVVDGEATIDNATSHDDPPADGTDAPDERPPSPRVDQHQWGQDDPSGAARPASPSSPPASCPACGGPLVEYGCWACQDGFCRDCGGRTGSPMHFQCWPCTTAGEAKRWAAKVGGMVADRAGMAAAIRALHAAREQETIAALRGGDGAGVYVHLTAPEWYQLEGDL